MPRIEIIPIGWYDSLEYLGGDGSPTVDVCSNCKDLFVAGEVLDDADGVLQDADTYLASLAGGTVGSVECDHPTYTDVERYSCQSCGALLGPEDD